jgi:hypothetical protein
MIAEIKQPTEKNAPAISPDEKIVRGEFATGARKLYVNFLLLLVVAAIFLFSIRYHQPLHKELVASGFILCYAFAMQLRAKRLVNDPNKCRKLN